MPDNDLVHISTRIVPRAKVLLEKECARRKKAKGGRVSEGVVIAEALLFYFGDGQRDGAKRPTGAAHGKSRVAA